MDAVPAARPLVGVDEQSSRISAEAGRRPLVQPARLRDADAAGRVAPGRQALEGDLHGERQLLLQADIVFFSPEDEASRERQEDEVAREIPPLDPLRQAGEGPEGQQIADALERIRGTDDERPRP